MPRRTQLQDARRRKKFEREKRRKLREGLTEQRGRKSRRASGTGEARLEG